MEKLTAGLWFIEPGMNGITRQSSDWLSNNFSATQLTWTQHRYHLHFSCSFLESFRFSQNSVEVLMTGKWINRLQSPGSSRNFTSASLGRDKLARRFWYRVHGKSITFTFQISSFLRFYLIGFVTQHGRARAEILTGRMLFNNCEFSFLRLTTASNQFNCKTVQLRCC